jgi:hypothetical protein
VGAIEVARAATIAVGGGDAAWHAATKSRTETVRTAKRFLVDTSKPFRTSWVEGDGRAPA